MKMVKRSLVDIGYPDNIEVTSYVGDNDSISYYAIYQCVSNDEKHIKPLRVKDVIELVKYSMEVQGYDSVVLNIRVRDEQICYSVETNIVTYGNGKGRSKRRR